MIQSGAGYSKRRQLSTQMFAPDIIFIYLETVFDKYYRVNINYNDS